jgi:hypothetical protein
VEVTDPGSILTRPDVSRSASGNPALQATPLTSAAIESDPDACLRRARQMTRSGISREEMAELGNLSPMEFEPALC